MRGEIRRDGHTCGDADFLVDLRGMTVHGDGIGRQPFACLGEQRILFQSAPGASDAGFGVDDEIMRVDEAGFHERHQREQHRCRIAAGARHQPRGGDLFPVQLCQSIDRLALQIRCAMRMAIPLRVHRLITQAEIRGHIQDIDRGIGLQHGRDDLLRRAVRQSAERQRRAWSSRPSPIPRAPAGRA